MKILSLFIILPSIVFAKFSFKDNMIQPFNLVNVDMKQFISDYADVIKRPLLIHDNIIKGKVNFSIQRAISLEDFNQMFMTVISTQGMNLINDKHFLRVIAERDVRYDVTKFYSSKKFPKNNQHILVNYELKHPLASEISKSIRPFMGRYGRLMGLGDGHTIIISDKGKNVSKLIKIIDNLDTEINLKEYMAKKLTNKKNEGSKNRDLIEQ